MHTYLPKELTVPKFLKLASTQTKKKVFDKEMVPLKFQVAKSPIVLVWMYWIQKLPFFAFIAVVKLHETYNYMKYDTLILYAEGPCGNAGLSRLRIDIQFDDCICPIGSDKILMIQYVCDSKIIMSQVNSKSCYQSLKGVEVYEIGTECLMHVCGCHNSTPLAFKPVSFIIGESPLHIARKWTNVIKFNLPLP